MNSVNISFQKQDLEIDRLPLLMNKLIKEIAELFLKENIIPKELSILKDLKWKTNNTWREMTMIYCMQSQLNWER